MKEILADIQSWTNAGKPVALATVVRTWGSAPRPAGSKMAVSGAGEMSGSVSAGCVEAAVAEEALEVLKGGRPRRLRYGVADETAWEVGLTCGGEIQVFVEPLASSHATTDRSVLSWLLDAVTTMNPAVRAVVIDGPQELLGRSMLIASDGRLSGSIAPGFSEELGPAARGALKTGSAETHSFRIGENEVELLLDPWLPTPTLVIVGGVHIAMILANLAHSIAYRVVVVDPRAAFATRERFPQADAIDSSWPDEALRRVGVTPATALAVLSHDPKLDDPALLVALRSPAFYVGALGSSRTNEQRRSRLLAAGLKPDELSRLHAPIGIGSWRNAPETIALGILAEIVAARSGRTPEEALPSLIDRPARTP
jgi:xanthine dehydrogenase accessory factor